MSESFGERLTRLYTDAGLTREQLAQKTGIDSFSIADWEGGDNLDRLTAEDLCCLATELKVSMDYMWHGIARSCISFLRSIT